MGKQTKTCLGMMQAHPSRKYCTPLDILTCNSTPSRAIHISGETLIKNGFSNFTIIIKDDKHVD